MQEIPISKPENKESIVWYYRKNARSLRNKYGSIQQNLLKTNTNKRLAYWINTQVLPRTIRTATVEAIVACIAHN